MLLLITSSYFHYSAKFKLHPIADTRVLPVRNVAQVALRMRMRNLRFLDDGRVHAAAHPKVGYLVRGPRQAAVAAAPFAERAAARTRQHSHSLCGLLLVGLRGGRCFLLCRTETKKSENIL